MQVDAFKDFSPDEAASASPKSGKAEASPAPQAAQPEEGEPERGEPDEGESSSGGDYPPHRLEGLPALSPTMSQGGC